jgi:hypothetical protein
MSTRETGHCGTPGMSGECNTDTRLTVGQSEKPETRCLHDSELIIAYMAWQASDAGFFVPNIYPSKACDPLLHSGERDEHTGDCP